jgi:glycosyltransferase involved in cell wall biosynthesis
MKASIVITCYNLGAYLGESLASALQSTHPDFEVMVVDDGSTEQRTREEVSRLEQRYAGDPRVRFVRQPNKGVSAARNTGIEQATGECILPLDADNKIRPHYLARAVQILSEQASVGVVYGWAERFGERGGIWEFPPLDPHKMLLENGVEACSVFRKQVWREVGGYDEERFRQGYEDWDFWLGVIEKEWQFVLIPEVLFDYRVRPHSMVSACNEPDVRQKLVNQLIEKHKPLYAACWPELLISRELTMLEYERLVAGYHQRYVEALAEFQHFAQDWNTRCQLLESEVQQHRSELQSLRHLVALQRYFARSALGRLLARGARRPAQ